MKIGALFIRDALYQTLKYPIPTDVLRGDINRDGAIDIKDLVRLKKNVPDQIMTDLNADGAVGADDLAIERKTLLDPPADNDGDNDYDIDW